MITLHCRPAGARPSEIRIAPRLRTGIDAVLGGRRAFVLVDGAVADRYPGLPAGAAGLQLDGGQPVKTLSQAESVLRAMARAGLDRQSLLVAVGGGSVGDLGGLCAALFLRGIDLWQVPTTLLAMVDSSVGGKTAVDLPEGKNLVGAVHPAALVLIDPEFVGSESSSQYRGGLAEAIKMAIGLDAGLFEFLERHAAAIEGRDLDALVEVIRRAIAAKIAVVEADLHEHGRRRVLNLGHTLGHALEAHSGYRLPHGLCVARGLHFALDVAAALQTMPPAAIERSRALLRRFGHERTPLPETAALMPFVARDKKAAGGAVHIVLPTAIGGADTRPLPLAELQRLLGG